MVAQVKSLPPKYHPTLPRVSSIVSFCYPFEGEGERRFRMWLSDKGIAYDDYMKEASEGGTYVHSKLEEYALTKNKNFKKYKKIVNSGIKFIEDYDVKFISTEKYIRTKDFQGTMDAVVEFGGKRYILDWKSYGLAKIKYGLVGVYRKPYDKLKKAQLQLSLYSMKEKVDGICVVELTEDGYYLHILDILPKKALELIVKQYKYSYVDNL